jgi:hypothetical protein
MEILLTVKSATCVQRSGIYPAPQPHPAGTQSEKVQRPIQPSCKSRQEHHKRRKGSTVIQHMKIIPQRMSLLAAAVSALIISQYDPRHKVGFDPTVPLREPCPNSFGFQHLLDPTSWACIRRSMAMPLQKSTQVSEYTKIRTPLGVSIVNK